MERCFTVSFFDLNGNSILKVWLIIQNIWAASWQNQHNDCASSKVSDQPGHSPSLGPRLIWVIAGCTCYFVGFVMRWLISCPYINVLTLEETKKKSCVFPVSCLPLPHPPTLKMFLTFRQNSSILDLICIICPFPHVKMFEKKQR